MRIRRVAAAIACTALIAQPALAQQWWEEAAASQPLDEVSVDHDGATRINWSDGYLEVVAEGTCDPAASVSQAHCRTVALKTARALGYEKLTETVYGISIDAENTYQDRMLENSRLETETTGLIRGARIIEESHEILPDGSILARVRLGMLLAGAKGLSSVAIPYVLDNPEELQRGAVSAQLEGLRRDLVSELESARALMDSLTDAKERLASSGEQTPTWKAVEEALEAADTAKEALAAARRAEASAQEAVRAAEAAGSTSKSTDERLAQQLREAQEAAAQATAKAAEVSAHARELEAAAASARSAAEQSGRGAEQIAQALSEVREARLAAEAARDQASEILTYASKLDSAAVPPPTTAVPGDVQRALEDATREAARARALADSLATASEQALARAEQVRREVIDRGEASSDALRDAREAKDAAERARREMEDLVASARRTLEEGKSVSTKARVAATAAAGAVSGVIVDASDLGARPALAPKVLTPSGDEVYGPSQARRDVVMNVGLVAYANSVSRAREIVDRVGENPLVIKAISTGGGNKANLVISEDDAKLIASLDPEASLSSGCAWCVVLS